MNRLENRVASWLSKARKTPSPRLNEQPFRLSSPHRLFIPEHFEARYDYPLFIWLHSNGSSELELDGVISEISLRNYVGLGLRGTCALPHNERLFGWGSSLHSMQMAEEQILDSIAQLGSQLRINSSRVFLGGFGDSGTLAQWIGLRNSRRFAGIVSIHGAFPHRHRPLAGWKSARRLPTLFMFGENSTLCDTDEVCRSMSCARTAGLNYRYSRFDCADDLFGDMCQAANRFMMQVINEQDGSQIHYEPTETDYLTGVETRRP